MNTEHSPELAEAYAMCRAIARREAKNFYWSFRVLPQAKSDAMCAVYAFMRRADDLSDEEALSIADRRAAMQGWVESWRQSRTEPTVDPVFLALGDTQRRFGISDALLEQLVAGTTMDLQAQPEGTRSVTVTDRMGRERTLHVYTTQEALEAYCYLVASVVGLVCIRIFGYSDPRAEALAVDTGKAFQLTNVLRDVKEDAERGRVYLPETLLAEFGVTPERLLALTSGQATAEAHEVTMLGQFRRRAEELYRSADALLPLLERDARPAMRVLVTIYHQLLCATAEPGDVVLRERVSVPDLKKMYYLGRGLAGSALARLRR